MKILMVSDSPTLSTGYGRVIKELALAFSKKHDVRVVGWGHNGEEHDFPFEIVPCDTRQHGHGEDLVAQIIRDERPDILFTLGDPWMLEYVAELEERSAVTWICYFPIDGYPIPPQWHNWIRSIDIPIVFSKFSQELVADVLGRIPSLIYHGVDTNKFHPIEGKEAIKSSFGLEGKFVVGTVARNQPRKNLPALIKAFSEFSKNKEDVVLYLHTQIRDVGWNIDELVQRFGVEGKVMSTGNFRAVKGISDVELNRIYNLFDIFVLPTMSEGFGLPILESQSCGTPVLVTDFSACPELVVSRQELIKVKDTVIMNRNIEQAIADTGDITRKLHIFYNDWKTNDSKNNIELGQKGRKLAKQLDWSKANDTFLDLLDKIEPKVKGRSKKITPSFYII
jgi:glycosyltransferase involved in cell wall biosynthesis